MRLTAAGVIVLLFLSLKLAWTQGSSGAIVGSVTDPSGAVVPNVQVAITSAATGLVLNLVTNSAGRYESSPLAPGKYSVAVSQSGFKKESTSVTLDVGQRLVADFALQLGSNSQELTVVEAAPLIQSESSSLGNVRTEKAVNDLPLNVRNFAFLITLAPGTVASFSQQSNSLSGTTKRGVSNFAVNGARPTTDWNSIKIEGIDDAENHNGFGIAVYPPVDAIQEFNLQTSAADAQYGSAAGGFVNLVLKSGGRSFHGDLYEFLRNSKLDAKNYFDSPTLPIPHFVFNQFGGTLGGPVTIPGLYNRDRNKTFFFVSAEGDIRRQALTYTNTVPTALMRTGDFSQISPAIYDPYSSVTTNGVTTRTRYPGNKLPANEISAVGLNALSLYPLPNQSGLANNYLYNPAITYNSYQIDFKVDHYFNPNDSLAFRGSVGRTNIFSPAALPAPAADGNTGDVSGLNSSPVRQFALTEHHVFSSSMVNELRVGFTRLDLTLSNINIGQDISTQIGIPGANTGSILTSGLTIISPSGYNILGDNGFTPAVIASNNYQTEDNFSWVRGSHSFRMGGQVERKQYNVFQTSAPRGSLNFNGGFSANPASSGSGFGLADLLLGLPSSGSIQLLDGTRGFRRTELGFFFQDDWKVTSRLTLNLGLRYENYIGFPWTEVGNRQSIFLQSTGTLVQVGTNGISRSGANGDNNNFSPRVGFAFAVTPKTLIRSAYAIFYAAPQFEITRNLGLNPPYAGTSAFTNSTLNVATARTISQGFSRSFQEQNAALNTLDPNLRMPYVQQWNFNVQHQFTGDMVLTVAYVGTKGTKLRDQYNINQPVPGPAAVASRRPDPFFNDIQYTANLANSSYNGLQVTLDKRLSRGLNFLGSYTYSHAIDTDTTFGGNHQNSLNLEADRGNADWDQRHNFSLSANYALPGPRAGVARMLAGGWQVNGILRLSTGLPYTISPATNTLNGSGAQRADVVAGCNATLSNPTPNRWFNTACFATPALYAYGNSARNLLFGPGTHQLDASLFRRFALGRADTVRSFELRGEVFNIANTPQFNNPNGTIGAPSAATISSAGSPPSFQRTSRQIQVAAKVYF